MDWDVDASGNVILHPLTAIDVRNVDQATLIARLEYRERSDAGEISEKAVQLAIQPREAPRLAQMLAAAAQEAMMRSAPGKPR